MPLFRRLTTRSQLILMLLLVSVGATAVVAHLGFRSGRASLTASIYRQLISVRSSKASQLSAYFALLRNQSSTLAEDRMIVAAVRDFRDAYGQMQGAALDSQREERLRKYYRGDFPPRVAKVDQAEPILDAYLPSAPESRALQHAYVAANPHPSGSKHLLDDAGDGSGYTRAHARIHPLLRNIAVRFGYYDLFLIDPDTGVILYSVFKETDFATSLLTGPYRHTSLADAFLAARDAKSAGFTKTVDFRAYGPSGGAPAAFMASPIYDGADLVGVFAAQIPVDEINRVMTGDQSWAENGLGASGESYVVGSDGMMRSISRFLVEDPTGYIQTLEALGTSPATLSRIRAFGTSILQQTVATEAVTEALLGREGTRTMPDYRGVDVLSSYAPVAIPDLDWVVLAEMDMDEAYAPVHVFRRTVLICSAVIVLVVTALAMGLANLFVAPVARLAAHARKASVGDIEAPPTGQAGGEVGELTSSYGEIISIPQVQSGLIESQIQAYDELLERVLPPAAATRYKRGDDPIADALTGVAVAAIDIGAVQEAGAEMDAGGRVSLMNEVVAAFDDVAERHGVEKVRVAGVRYVAACGITVPRADGVIRLSEFASDVLSYARRLSRDRGVDIPLRIGIDTGHVVAGVVGDSRPVYDVWGDPVTTAERLVLACPTDAAALSGRAREQLHDTIDVREQPGSAEAEAFWVLSPASGSPA